MHSIHPSPTGANHNEPHDEWWMPREETGPWEWVPKTWLLWALTWTDSKDRRPDPPEGRPLRGWMKFYSHQSRLLGNGRRKIGWVLIPKPPIYGKYLLQGWPDGDMKWVKYASLGPDGAAKPQSLFNLPGVWPNTITYDRDSNTLVTVPYSSHATVSDPGPYLIGYPHGPDGGLCPYDLDAGTSPFREGTFLYLPGGALDEWRENCGLVEAIHDRFEYRVRATGGDDGVMVVQYPDCVLFQTWKQARKKLATAGPGASAYLLRRLIDVTHVREFLWILLDRMFPTVRPGGLADGVLEPWQVEVARATVDGLAALYERRAGRKLYWRGVSASGRQRAAALLVDTNETGQRLLELLAAGWDCPQFRGVYWEAARRSSLFDRATSRFVSHFNPGYTEEEAVRVRARVLAMLRSPFGENPWLAGNTTPFDQWLTFLSVCYFAEVLGDQ